MPISKQSTDAILQDFIRRRDLYESCAQELLRLFDPKIDPSVPSDSIYTVRYRIKGESRLVEKIRGSSADLTVNNYQQHFKDLLGIRVVCFLGSDVDVVGAFIEALKKEQRLKFLTRPVQKKSFLIPSRSSSERRPPKDIELQPSGYSSDHYLIGLGKAVKPAARMADLRAELQVRTIFEEAWGELDHRHRYEFTRRGHPVPEYVDNGFHALSLELQAAALNAGYLCSSAQRLASRRVVGERRRSERKTLTSVKPELKSHAQVVPESPDLSARTLVESALGVQISDRALKYLEKRISDAGLMPDWLAFAATNILPIGRVERYKKLFHRTVGRDPFSPQSPDVEFMSLVDWSLFERVHGTKSAEEFLASILRRRLTSDAVRS